MNKRRRLMDSNNETINIITIKPKDAKAGDICLYDIENDKKIIINKEYCSQTYFPIEKFYPIGVVVVPGSHNCYSELNDYMQNSNDYVDSCSIISLNWMHPTNLQQTRPYSMNGSSVRKQYYTIIGLPNLTSNNHTSYTYTSDAGQGYGYGASELSSVSLQYPTGENMDNISGYCKNAVVNVQCPSPYLVNDEKNQVYHYKQINNMYSNALSEFNSLYLTISSSNTSYADGICKKYYTIGTKIGDWYLPSIGELGYLCARFETINDSLIKIKNTYNIGADIVSNTGSTYYLWSCIGTNVNYYSNYMIDVIRSTNIGQITYTYYDKYNYARAFTIICN